MEQKLGFVMFEGKMYNLDEMDSNSIKELIEKMEKYDKTLEKKAEILAEIYNTKEEVK